MEVGFTGTRKGMSEIQKELVDAYLGDFCEGGRGIFHHGDCIGADSEAHDIARSNGYQIYAHPPTNQKDRAFRQVDATYPMKPYLVRNMAIVDSCEVLIAAPGSEDEVLRSGTWSTIRYARKRGCHIFIIDPKGGGTEENPSL